MRDLKNKMWEYGSFSGTESATYFDTSKAEYVTLISRSRELGMSISRETELKHDGNNRSLAYQPRVLLQLGRP
jgi:hypothetical protein